MSTGVRSAPVSEQSLEGRRPVGRKGWSACLEAGRRLESRLKTVVVGLG